MKTATKSFRFEDAYGGGTVVEGERIDDSHELVRLFPECWRNFGLDEELKVRSERVAELREQASRPATSEPLSRAGLVERDETRFWAQVDRDLHPRDTPTSEGRFWAQATAQIEDADAAEVRDANIEIDKLWYGRAGG